MSDEHEASGAEAAPDQPHFLSGLKGIVAGITSAAVAITALLAAVTNLFGNHHAEPERAAAVAAAETATGPTGSPAPEAAEAASVPTHYAGSNSDGQTIEVDWDGKHWVYTDPQSSYVYADLTSTDTDMVLAYDRDIDGYLRWPTAGGAVEESFKSQLEYKPIGMLKPGEAK